MFTDAELIAANADLMIFVTRHNHTPKEFVKVNNYDTERKITNTGIIFNGIKHNGMGYYGYNYGYGYYDLGESKK